MGVVYPELVDPYDKVFQTIIGGIEQAVSAQIDKYPLGESFDPDALESSIRRNRNRVVLTLGTRGRQAMRELDLDIPIVVGAVLSGAGESNEKELSGISLLPDPAILFDKLLSLAPAIRVVSVVYNPDVNQGLIDDAEESARHIGLVLDPRPARDIRASALLFKALAETIDGRSNAIWLLPDRSTIDTEAILPSLLENAWNRQFIVFSTKLEHAKRGVLFSMFPDNFQMGQDLGRLARELEVDRVRKGIIELRALKTAVNSRTAKHLGIDLLSRESDAFDLVFPMQ
ncbi:MAG: ABC transporter substrate-binding protein [Gammaproteobacteria bacterium]